MPMALNAFVLLAVLKKGGGHISGISLENRPTHMHMQNVHKELVNHILVVF